MDNSQKFYSSTLFPDPSIADQPLNYRGKKRNHRDDEDEISAFGYESKIYNDQSTAINIENGSYLIPWKSQTDARVLMDRYDVRHFIENQALFQVDQKAILDNEHDRDRYAEMGGDISEDLDGSRNKAAIPFNYDDDDNTKEEDGVTTEIEKIIMTKYKTPSSMHVPKTQEQLSIIEATAKEIGSAATNSNLLEIRIQVKNASNALYSFLNRQDTLYPFYKHVLGLLTPSISAEKKTRNSSLVEYSDSDSEDEDDEEPPIELKQAIIKTAEFISKSNNSDELEQHIKLKKGHDPKFKFLNPSSAYYNYFKSQIIAKRKR